MEVATHFLTSASTMPSALPLAAGCGGSWILASYDDKAKVMTGSLRGTLTAEMMVRLPVAFYAATAPALGLGVGAAVLLTPAIMNWIAIKSECGPIRTGVLIVLGVFNTACSVAALVISGALFMTVAAVPFSAYTLGTLGLVTLYGSAAFLNTFGVLGVLGMAVNRYQHSSSY